MREGILSFLTSFYIYSSFSTFINYLPTLPKNNNKYIINV
nr:MAG TPA: hypothetical protein [Caudoviricetes sp.]